MKILILTFYFRPDLSAGSFRATALVEALRQLAPPRSQIHVVTTLPNRYQSFSIGPGGVASLEADDVVSICRIPIPKHRSGFVDQAKAFFAFSRGALAETRGREYDVIFATSSRLMTGALAAWVARRKKAPLYLDIRDIFAETIGEVFRGRAARIATRVFAMLERWMINTASRINLVSPGFEPYFSARYPNRRFSYLTNGIDDEFLVAFALDAGSRPRPKSQRPLVVLYAGNIGEGQGLHLILPGLAQQMGPEVRFRVIGDGGRRAALQDAVDRAAVRNVELLPPIRREGLIDAYRTADVLFLHLNDYRAFERVLPSKVFEYAATGKPIWAGVSGYPATFIQSEIPNAAIFRPCDVGDAIRTFAELQLCDRRREEFVMKYARKNLSLEMAAAILAAAETNG